MNPYETVSYLFFDAVVMETLQDTGNADVVDESSVVVVVVNSTITMATSLVSLNYNLPTMVVVATVLFVVIIATAIGNLLVGLALFRYQYLRTISNYLIGNLALSDFLLATTIFPLSTVNECLGHWIFGQTMCNLWLLTDVLYCTASLWNICVIAFDRFTATLYPIWYREKRSTRRAALYVATVWFIASSICVPPLLGWNDLTQNYIYDNVTDVYYCVLFETPSYVLYSASGSFFVPFFLTVFLYVQIFIVLRKRMAKMRASKAKSSASSSSTAAAAAAAAAASRLKNSRLPPVPKHQSNNMKHVNVPETEFEMTSFVVLSKREGGRGGGEGGVAEEGSLKSFLSSDSGDDLDQNRPLQGGRSPRVRGRNLIDGSPTADAGASRRGRAAGGSLGPKKCSVRFLTGLKLVHWTRSTSPGNGSSMAHHPPSSAATPSPLATRSFDAEDRIQVIRAAAIADNDTDNQTTKLVGEEEEEEEEEEMSGKDGEGARKVELEPRRQRHGRPTNGCNRRHSTLLGRIFKYRSLPWKSSNWHNNSKQGNNATTSSGNISIQPAAAGCVAQQPVLHLQQQQHRRFDQKEIQATIRMAIIIAFFCGMWLGFFVVYVVHGWCTGCAVPRELDAFFFWLGYSNSSINPILYTIFNEDFRKAFQKILGCYRKHDPNSSGSSSTPKH